jgi:hypothetical protein
VGRSDTIALREGGSVASFPQFKEKGGWEGGEGGGRTHAVKVGVERGTMPCAEHRRGVLCMRVAVWEKGVY